MQKYRLMFKKSYFRNLCFSYGLMLLVLFLIFIIMSSVLNNIIAAERESMISYMSTNLKNNMDDEILRIEQLVAQISIQDEITKLIETNDAVSGFEEYEIVRKLKEMCVLNPTIDKIYLYKKNSGKIISSESATSIDVFYEATHNSESFSVESWTRFLNENHNKTLTTLPNVKPGEVYITYAQTLPFSVLEERNLQLIILLNPDRIIHETIENDAIVCEQFAILNKAGDILYSYGNLVSADEMRDFAENMNDVIKTKTSGEKVVIQTVRSKVVSWRYVMVLSREIYNEQMRFFTIALISCGALYLLIGIYLVFLFSKKNYAPLKNLMNRVGKAETDAGNKVSSNEFEVLSAQFEAIYNENLKMQKLSDENIGQLQTEYLKGLLENVINHKSPAKEYSPERYGLEVISDRFSVILIKIENLEEMFSIEAVGLKPDSIRYAIANVAEELIDMQGCKGYCITLQNDSMAAIVNFPEETENGQAAEKILRAIITEMKSFFEKCYYAALSFSSSNELHSLRDLNMSYGQVLEAMDYRLIRGKQQIIFYQEICDKRNDYHYDADMEYELASGIKNGDYPKTQKLINEMFEENVYSERLTVEAMRLFLFELLRTLMRYVPREYVPSMEKLMTDTARETQEKVLSALKEYSDLIKNQTDKPVGLRVMEYVEENYQNPDLGVSMLGEIFGLTPSYLSRLFKEQANENMLSYIHRVRISHSKDLLDSGMSLKDIAEQVGYLSVGGYNRVFKKYEGISPDKFRKRK